MKKNTTRDQHVSTIGARTSLVGNISFQDNLIVEGVFQGKVQGGDTLHIKKGSNVKADLVARRIIIAGNTTGKIIASESLEIVAGSRVKGQIITKVLRIEDGAAFEGHCEMRSDVSDNEVQSLQSANRTSK